MGAKMTGHTSQQTMDFSRLVDNEPTEWLSLSGMYELLSESLRIYQGMERD
jgi:hypothetical protein